MTKEKINMGWGSTFFLDSYWEKVDITIDEKRKPLGYKVGSSFILKLLIKDIHKKIENAEIEGKTVVVAAGATQILLGLMAVLAKRGYKTAFAKKPYFSRFPKLADIAKLKWVTKKEKKSVVIVTNPNNPDFDVSNEKDAIILDLCYNWPQYTGKVKKYDHPIMVFSLSKATGHASTRIGWALLSDKTLAKELEDYIEISTGGLSIDSQVKAVKVLEHQLKAEHTIFEFGKSVLKKRWGKINKLKNKANFPLEFINKSGMFAWTKIKPSEQNLSIIDENVQYLNGAAMGENDSFIRLNVGCSDEDFDAFIDLMKSTIDKKQDKS